MTQWRMMFMYLLLMGVSSAQTLLPGETGANESLCDDGTYWDSALTRCERCDQLCAYSTVQDLPDVCLESCKALVPSTTPRGNDSSGMQMSEIWVVFLMLTVIIVSIVGGLVLWKCWKKLPTRSCFWKEKLTVPQQEQGQAQQEDISLHEPLNGTPPV